MTYTLDPAVFRADAIADETAALNADILARLSASPETWSATPAIVRDLRARGLGPFGPLRKCDHAEMISVDGPHGEIPLRIIRPVAGPIRGVYLHIHGGGWVLGACDQQDPGLERIANNCGLAVVSVEYRLAPEHPYPKGPDDCEAAALWVIKAAPSLFGTSLLVIGGESAGAHLSVVTLLRLRDKHHLTPFAGANLTAGCYDLAGTPSAKAWGLKRLILSTRDMEMFVRHFLVHGGSTDDPDISPLNAKLHGMPYTLFSIGTQDCLLDDTLFMAARWTAAGNGCELAVYPGGAHVFQHFPFALAEESLTRIDQFLTGLTGCAA
jgi:acetyl esterase/lipase